MELGTRFVHDVRKFWAGDCARIGGAYHEAWSYAVGSRCAPGGRALRESPRRWLGDGRAYARAWPSGGAPGSTVGGIACLAGRGRGGDRRRRDEGDGNRETEPAPRTRGRRDRGGARETGEDVGRGPRSGQRPYRHVMAGP